MPLSPQEPTPKSPPVVAEQPQVDLEEQRRQQQQAQIEAARKRQEEAIKRAKEEVLSA